MFTRIKEILTYYDTEPSEIIQGIIWTIFFPVIYTLDFGLNLCLIIPSLIIGIAQLKATCFKNLAIRKVISFLTFLFSTVVLSYYMICDKLITEPTNLIWLLISIISFTNLVTITNRYYRKLKKWKK